MVYKMISKKVNRINCRARLSRQTLCIIACFLISPYSSANDQATQSIEPTDLDEVSVIATRSEQPLNEKSNNVFVLSKAELEATSAVHIQQVLSQTPGVGLQRGEGQESLPSIRSAVQTGAGACGSVLAGSANRSGAWCW